MRGLLLTLLVLIGLLVVADRVAVGVTEDRVAEEIAVQGALAGAPDVSIEGWPFLTQALAGRYEDVRIRLSAADLGEPEGTTADVRLRGARVPLSDVIDGSVARIPVDRIDGEVTLSYALLSRELGTDAELVPEGEGVRLAETIEVGGREVPLTAVGRVTLDGQDLVIDVEEAGAAGAGLPDSVVDAASDLLDLRYAIELPFGLQLNGVRLRADGVHVTGGARDTVLSG